MAETLGTPILLEAEEELGKLPQPSAVSALRALVQTVRFPGAPIQESADGDWLVVIMRGLPGCGKSTASKQLTEAWQTTHRSSKRSSSHTAICSADSFFEAGAGLSRRRLREMAAMPGAPRDTYRLVWSVERLGRAHQSCRQQFTDAINYECGLIIVDNTNTTLDEYAYYQKTALYWGYEVLVVEVVPGDTHSPRMLEVLHARCSHGVPMATMVKLSQRWQVDATSTAVARLRPLGLSAALAQEQEGAVAAGEQHHGHACTVQLQ